MTNVEAIKEYNARSVDLVREFCRDAERTLSAIASSDSADESAEGLLDLRHEIERFVYDLDQRLEIRDGVTDVAFIAKQQLSTAVNFGQADRIEKLLRLDSLLKELPWLRAVDAIRHDRSYDRLTDSQYRVCLTIVAVLTSAKPATAKEVCS